MAERVIVFIDYMNTYKSARDAFGFWGLADHWEGQVHPRTLGEQICGRFTNRQVELQEVRVYRGRPSNNKDPKGYAAFQRQQSIWEKTNLVTTLARDLRYPDNYPDENPQEKAIDVLLALDFVMMAVHDHYDIGVMFSHDTDLVPALDHVLDMDGIEPWVAAWQPDDGHGHRLRTKGDQVRCLWFPRNDYAAVRDGRDYNTKSTHH